MKLDINKALITAEVLAWTFIVTTFALNLFGFEVVDTTISNPYILQFVRFVDSSKTIRFITNVVFGVLVVNVMYACVIPKYFKLKTFIFINIYIFTMQIIISYLSVLQNMSEVCAIISMLNYFMPFIFVHKIVLCIKIMVFDNVFIFATNLIFVNLNFETNNLVIFILFSLDYFCLWFIQYIRNRRKTKWHYGLDLVQDFLKKKLTQLKTWLTNMLKRMQKVQMKMKKHGFKSVLIQLTKELGFYIRHDLTHKFKRKVLPHVIVYTLYLGYAVVVDKVLQAVFLYVAYVCFYRLFPKHFHADYIPGIKKNWITRTCVCLSALMLCTALHNVIGGGLSVMSSIIVAFAIDWILYVIRDWLDFNLRYETDFTKYGLSIEMSNFAYDWKVEGLRDKQLMIKYEINSVNTLNSRKRRIKQAMHTK